MSKASQTKLFQCICGHMTYWIKRRGWTCMCGQPRQWTSGGKFIEKSSPKHGPLVR